MPVDFSVRAHGDLKALGKYLKDTGEKQRTREVLRAIDRETKPVKALLAESARRTLPHAGGLNEFVADARIATRTRLWGRNVGVRIVGEQTKAKSQALKRRALARRHGRKSARGLGTSSLGTGTTDLSAINRGRVRHPIYGHWVAGKGIQRVTPGWFSTPLRTLAAVRVRRAVVTVIGRYLEQAAHAAGKRAA